MTGCLARRVETSKMEVVKVMAGLRDAGYTNHIYILLGAARYINLDWNFLEQTSCAKKYIKPHG